MKLKGKTNSRIRKLVGSRIIEVPERDGQLNEILSGNDADVGDWWPLKVGLDVEDVDGLIELDLYLYGAGHWLRGNKAVWVFEDGRGEQHVYIKEQDMPSEFERAIRRVAK